MSVSWSDYGKYATDIFTDEAVKAINNHGNKNTTQPLFLYLAHLAVHSANTVQSQIFAYLVSLSKFLQSKILSRPNWIKIENQKLFQMEKSAKFFNLRDI